MANDATHRNDRPPARPRASWPLAVGARARRWPRAAATTASAERPGAAAPTGRANATHRETVKIGFSAPAADHGWLGAVITGAEEEADKHKATSNSSPPTAAPMPTSRRNNIRTLAGQDLDAIAILPVRRRRR